MAPPVIHRPATGPDDFRSLRAGGHYYIDKSGFIEELLRQPDPVILIPRPRRFGKSLHLSMLRDWFERPRAGQAPAEDLFDDLAISAAHPEIQAHRGRYPVVMMSLKEARGATWAQCQASLAETISRVAADHPELRESPALSPEDRDRLAALLAGNASSAALESALLNLCRWLAAHHGAPVLVLIDEYDAPVEAGHHAGYYDAVITFLRGFFGAAFKSNPTLWRGVLTGVRRVSKESVFSGLNNVRVCSLLESTFAGVFGFTDAEVVEVLAAAGRPEALAAARSWYNGYRFGGVEIYNPWSVLNFARSGLLQPYWVNTSSDELLAGLVTTHGAGLRGAFERLLDGGTVLVEIDEHVVFPDLSRAPEALWSFLLTAGYLKAVDVLWTESLPLVDVAIPNREVRGVWRRQFVMWLERGLGSGPTGVAELLGAILSGDVRVIQRILRVLVTNTLSYHDTPGSGDPERVYQAFVLGLLVWLEPHYRVRSNRESGHGRADVLILPVDPGQPGVVIEIKRVWRDEDETPEAAIQAAHAQIEARAYVAELEAVGATPIHRLAIVFDQKQVWVG